MRRLFIFILLLSICLEFVYAQSPYKPVPNQSWDDITVLDTAYVKLSYNFTFRDALFHYTSQSETFKKREFKEGDMCKDIRVIEVGKNVQKDYSLPLEACEQANKQLIKESKLPTNLNGNSYPFELFTFKNSYRINRRTLLNGPIIQYEFDRHPIHWTLSNEIEQIEDYKCQKAEAVFGGRKWIAWFDREIPIDAGPYKFCGLPGLIIKVSDSEDHFCWTLAGIEKKSCPIYEKIYLFHKCSKEKAENILANMYAQPFLFLRNYGIKSIMSDGKGGIREPGEKEFSLSLYYDPIEVEK